MASKPELIFIHGAGSNAGFWQMQREAFPGAHFVNLPGHSEGREPVGEPGFHSVEEYAGWVARYVEGLGIKSVVLNGHSMGGAITLTLALRRPEWLRGIVLTGTGARLRVLPSLLDLLSDDYVAAVDLIMEWSFATGGDELSYAQKVRHNGTRRQLLRTPSAVTATDYRACNVYDVMPRVREIKLPALCIVGAQDRMTPLRYSQFLHEAIVGSELEIIEGAGHMLPLEQPDRYNRALRSFLEIISREERKESSGTE
ncbi:MAG: alpha/beta hydrolase [Chloroflexota bacterium]|nr:alpha/beta hydrolase [Chloroflexota bacterium]